jgi:hypothetical protein
MINKILLILIFTVFVSILYAQPANDDCTNAITFTNLEGECIDFNTMMSTFDIANGECASPANQNIWFSFVAQETDIEISASSPSDGIFITLVEFSPENCDFASITQLACGSENAGNDATITYEALTIGNMYHIIANVGDTVGGPGTICVNKSVTIPTLGQWGLMILCICLLTFGVVKLKSKEKIRYIKVLE